MLSREGEDISYIPDNKLPSLDIFDYRDHKVYLKDLYKYQKESEPQTSWTSFSKKLGISHSLLKMLVNGKRNFTIEQVHSVSRRLKLLFDQQEYFEIMVLYHQGKTPEEKAFYTMRWERFRSKLDHQNKVINPRLIHLEWYIPALMVYLMRKVRSSNTGFDAIDWQETSQKLGIPYQEIKSTVQRLKDLQVINDQNKRVSITIDNLTSSISQKKLVRLISEESIDRLKKTFNEPDTFFHAVACTLRPEDLPRLRNDLKVIMNKYSGENQVDPAEQRVFQCLFHIWPFEKS